MFTGCGIQYPGSTSLDFQLTNPSTASNYTSITSNMKGDPTFAILRHTAWLDASQFETKILGAIVHCPFKPSNDYVPQCPWRYNQNDLATKSFTEFVNNSAQQRSHDASAALESLIGVQWEGKKSEAVHLQGKRLRCVQLQQHEQFWSELMTNEAVRSTVPGWISIYNSWPPCLVVGIMIAEDVELDSGSATESKRHVDLDFPVAAVAAAAAGVPAAGLLSDLDVGNGQTGVGTSRNETAKFTAKLERGSIFALELRKVTTANFWSRKLKLDKDGPKVPAGRLAGADEQSSGSEDEDERVSPEDVIIETLTEKDYDNLFG